MFLKALLQGFWEVRFSEQTAVMGRQHREREGWGMGERGTEPKLISRSNARGQWHQVHMPRTCLTANTCYAVNVLPEQKIIIRWSYYLGMRHCSWCIRINAFASWIIIKNYQFVWRGGGGGGRVVFPYNALWGGGVSVGLCSTRV